MTKKLAFMLFTNKFQKNGKSKINDAFFIFVKERYNEV
jgi:hypothetical protein